MAITYFNWDEIFSKSRKDLASIIYLTYGQTSLYNELSAKTMMRRLNLNHVPLALFKNSFTQYDNRLRCNYKTETPLSYFKNPDFLFDRTAVSYKVVYLRALSMRRISEKVDYIPRDFYPKVVENPYLEITTDKIHFIQESSVSRKTTEEPMF
jgi:hypothetical protein|tara:strand:- start:125 stop:583 length:459 start_codon:yes stop_codon:yes gene_type:complete